MLIWVVAILLCGIFGALGYAKGAIRAVFPLVGLFVGAALALPLGPMVEPLVPKMGLENPIWSILLPPVIIFVLVSLLFVIIGFAVHWKLNLHFKYRVDEYTFSRWVRLNQRVGACMGLVAGVVYTMLIGLVVYVLGYASVQLSSEGSEVAAIEYLNKARADLHSSGLETTVAGLDPAPEAYYEAADVLGLLRHNPLLDSRLAAYPPFLTLPDRPEFESIATDLEYQKLLKGQGSLAEIIQHPKTQELIVNQPLLDELGKIDLPDLYGYLKTGNSEIYGDEPVLGKWEVDFYGTLRQEKKRRSRMKSSEMLALRAQMELIKRMKLIIAPDNTIRLKGPDVSGLVRQINENPIRHMRPPERSAVAAAIPANAVPMVQQQQNSIGAQRMANRYGVNPGGARQPQQPVSGAVVVAQPAQDQTPALTMEEVEEQVARLPETTLAEGKWDAKLGSYEMKLKGSPGLFFFGNEPNETAQAFLKDEQLQIMRGNQTLVLDKI